MRKIIPLIAVALLAPGLARAMDCSTNLTQPLSPARLIPVADELPLTDAPLGTPSGVLSQTADANASVDQVLLRIRLDSCRSLAHLPPAGGSIAPGDPAAYKPRTAFDNTPWRFNMSQNGRKMTTDEFAAWMASKGVHVARGAGAAPVAPAPVDGTAQPAPTATPPNP